ncbi:MAG: penicillin-binding protein, family [Bacteroidetes bacterium]|nr:penicillin-binding protein, family [Bacteroidota bacterium]
MADEHGKDYTPEEMERYFNDPEYRKQKRSATTGNAMKKSVKKYLIILGAFLVLTLPYVIYLFSGLPSLERIENPRPELATKVYSIDGEVLDQFFIKNRSSVSIKDVPITVVDALIATEDKNFYSHWGVDATRFVKAMIKNVILFRREGASTITQQLSRNLYLGHSDRHIFDTITRKLREFLTAIQLEQNFTKDEILEFYLNVVYFGRGSYGISSASQVYFGKPPADLSLPEVATLIALLKGPAYYDPTNHPERALARRNTVLSQMEKYGYISPEVAAEAKAEELQLKGSDDVAAAGIAPHFVENIRQQLAQKAEKYGFDLYRDGLAVYTTLDSRMQRYANQAVDEHLPEYQTMFDGLWDWNREKEVLVRVIDQAIRTSPEYRKAASARQRDSVYSALRSDKAWVDSMKLVAQRIEMGFVALDPQTGNILAMIGGANFKNFKYGLNHVTQIRRQVGSTFKPFVFTVAIDNNYPPTYELLNQPVTLIMADGKRWTPSNSDGKFGGKYTLRDGLKESINLIAVRAIMEIAPVKSVIDYAQRMGISSPLPPYESLALGAGDVSPLEMTAAFGVFANHGVYVEPNSILRIDDKDGNTIEENMPLRREVLSEETSFIMTSMLQGVVDEGTGTRIRQYFHLPAAGKTGTTNDFADAWFVGYTPHISAGVWVGFDNKTVHFTNWDGQGGRAAAPIWGRFMKYVYDDPSIAMPLEYFQKPAGVTLDTICADTKKLATEYCPNKTTEYFTEKTRPGKCNKHTTLRWNEGEEGLGTISF